MTVDKAQSFLLTIVCIWMLIPIFAFGDIYRAVALIAMALYFYLELIRKNSAFKAMRKDCFFTGFFIVISLCFFTISGTLLIQTGFLIFLLFLFIFWLKQGRVIILPNHIYFIFFLMLISLISSIYFLSFVDSHAARVLVRSSDLAREYSSSNVGGYGFIYSCLILLPILFYEIRKQYRVRNITKLSFLVLFFLCAMYYIYLGGYTIALAGLLLALLLLIPIFRDRVVVFSLVTLPLGLFIFLGDGLTSLMPSFVLDLLDGTSYISKLNSIIYYDANDLVINDSFEVRRERYQRSLSLLMENLFFGTFDYNPLGKHSTILDTAAMFGVFYLMFFLFILIRFLLYSFKKSGSRLVFVTGYLFFYVVSLNNLVLHFAVILFIFLPGLLNDNLKKSSDG